MSAPSPQLYLAIKHTKAQFWFPLPGPSVTLRSDNTSSRLGVSIVERSAGRPGGGGRRRGGRLLDLDEMRYRAWVFNARSPRSPSRPPRFYGYSLGQKVMSIFNTFFQLPVVPPHTSACSLLELLWESVSSTFVTM